MRNSRSWATARWCSPSSRSSARRRALPGLPKSARPLRSLSFEVDLNVATVLETPGGNVPTGVQAAVVTKGRVVRQSRPSARQRRLDREAPLRRKGSITIDVVKATEDAGLIVDVAENASDRIRPKVRLGVAVDGGLLVDPATRENVTEEEIALVRWLARGFYGDRPTDPGTAWTIDQSSTGHVDLEHYRVVEHDAHTRDARLHARRESRRRERLRGDAGRLAGVRPTLIVPLKATFQTDTRRQVGSSYDTVRTTVALTLLSDSFAPRR